MRRTVLVKEIAKLGRERGINPVFSEGGKHTKVSLGTAVTFIPRHREIDEHLARAILNTLKGK